MKKIIIVSIVVIVILGFLPIVSSENGMENKPDLETSIRTGFNMIFYMYVENIGDETAHNVTLTNVTVDGNVIFNFQEINQYSVNIPPGERTIIDPNSFSIGFGVFTVTMTVSCDEKVMSTASANGLMFGPFYIIP
jgi:hypothetical protein